MVDPCTRIIQLSDIHLFATPDQKLLGSNTSHNLQLILQMITRDSFKPDQIIITGDLSQDQSKKSYEALIQAFRVISCPIYWVAGNHDDLTIMKKILAGKWSPEKSIITPEKWQIILLNSNLPGKVDGFLNKKELQYLQNCLQESTYKFAMVMLHHHPISVGSIWLDAIGLKNADDFFEILQKSERVKAIVFGHVHQEFVKKDKSFQYIGTPAVAIQFLPHSDNFSLDIEPPGYRCIELYESGKLKTWVKRLENYHNEYDLNAVGY